MFISKVAAIFNFQNRRQDVVEKNYTHLTYPETAIELLLVTPISQTQTMDIIIRTTGYV